MKKLCLWNVLSIWCEEPRPEALYPPHKCGTPNGGSQKQNAPTGFVGAGCGKSGNHQLLNTEKRLPGIHGAASPLLKPVKVSVSNKGSSITPGL